MTDTRTDRLVWALVVATGARDDDGREALLDEVAELDQVDGQELTKSVLTGLAALAAGFLFHGAPSREAALDCLRRVLLELAVRAEGGAAE